MRKHGNNNIHASAEFLGKHSMLFYCVFLLLQPNTGSLLINCMAWDSKTLCASVFLDIK